LKDFIDKISAELNDADNFAAYPNLKSQTVNWISDDAEHMFAKNLALRKDELTATGLSETEIQYSINSNGFRSPEFLEDNWLAVAGCSFTFGVGIPLESTWSYIVANQLGFKCANFGKPGASPDTCFRMCYYWLYKLKPTALIYLEPPLGRFELLNSSVKVDKNCGIYYANIRSVSEKKYNLYVEWSRNFLNFDLNYRKNKLAIQAICDEIGIPMFSYSMHNKDLEIDKLSRDLLHSGTEANRKFAERILSTHF